MREGRGKERGKQSQDKTAKRYAWGLSPLLYFPSVIYESKEAKGQEMPSSRPLMTSISRDVADGIAFALSIRILRQEPSAARIALFTPSRSPQ